MNYIVSEQVKTLTLVNKLSVNDQCVSICYHQNSLYCGLAGQRIVRMRDGVPHEYLQLDGKVCSVKEYLCQLYVLVKIDGHFEVRVYNISGQEVLRWNHLDWCMFHNHLVVGGGYVYVVDRSRYQLITYTICGEVYKKTTLRKIRRSDTALCLAPEDRIIIRSANSVLSIDRTTGAKIWENNSLINPGGVAVDSDGTVYVLTAEKQNIIHICLLSKSVGTVSFRVGYFVHKSEPSHELYKTFDLIVDSRGKLAIIPAWYDGAIYMFAVGTMSKVFGYSSPRKR